MNERFMDDANRAAENWTPTTGSANSEAVHVNAEAKTGSRYAVVVTHLPITGEAREGGAYLVSVLQPWQTSYVVAVADPLHLDYVVEKLCRPGARPEQIHGGDAEAMRLTINYALGHFGEWTGLARSAGQQGLMPEVMPHLH